MHNSSIVEMSDFFTFYLRDKLSSNLKILDVGSLDVNGSYRVLIKSSNWSYTGLDLVSGKNVDVVITDNYSWHELKDNSFDVVISGQTLEHVGAPWLWFSEVKRVLCVGGLCCVIAPSAGPEHKYPVDCYRFYTDGLIFLAEYVGLKVLRCHTNNVYPWRDSVLVAKKI